MSIRDELLAIQKADPDNILHASDAVEWARDNPASALYAAIEWNDEKAANEHRLWQVRRLVQLHVMSDDMTPQLVSLTFDRTQGGGYRSISDVVKMPDLREIMLRDALEELGRVQKKYERVAELAAVWQAADAARVKGGRKRRVEAAAVA